jgi:hypothetical protein
MTDPNAPSSAVGATRRRWATLAALALGFFVAAFAMRMSSHGISPTDDRMFFHDGDTVRRLLRLEELATATSYPNRSAYEGYPDGPTLHWTRPMDWVIQALDGIVPSIGPRARVHESGAAYAGPVLGALAVLACALLLLPWLGLWLGSVATALFCLSRALVETTRFGNGDHQSLQQLCLTVGLLGFLRLVAGGGGRGLAVVVGLGVGASLWVTSESLPILMLCGLAVIGVAVTSPAATQRAALGPHLVWSLTCLAVCAVGNMVENPGRFGTLQWDRISLVPIVASAVIALYAAIVADLPLRRASARALAGAAVVLVGVAAFTLAPSVRGVLAGEFDKVVAAQRWGGFCISEFQPLLKNVYSGDVVLWGALPLSFTWVVVLVPICVGLWLRRADVPLASRLALAMFALGTFGLTLFEVKLAPIFSIVQPLVLVLGGLDWALRRFTAVELRFAAHAAAVVAVLIYASGDVLVAPPPNSSQALVRASRVEMVREINRLRTAADDANISLLGPWQVGAFVTYYCRRPVVASAFHRNMAGIEDSFRAMLVTPPEALPILQRRKVRWVIYSGDPWFLVEAKATVPDLPTIAMPVRGPNGGLSVTFVPEGSGAVWSKPDMIRGAGFQLHMQYESQYKPYFFGLMSGPMFRLYRVVYDGEK